MIWSPPSSSMPSAKLAISALGGGSEEGHPRIAASTPLPPAPPVADEPPLPPLPVEPPLPFEPPVPVVLLLLLQPREASPRPRIPTQANFLTSIILISPAKGQAVVKRGIPR